MIKDRIYDAEDKLRKACALDNLEYKVYVKQYPIVFEITKANPNNDQIKMPVGRLDNFDPDMKIELIFGEELKIRTIKDIEIDDDILSSIKRKAKDLHYLYLQLHFQESMFKRRAGIDSETGEILEIKRVSKQ